MHRSFFLFAFFMLVIFLSRMIAQPCDPSPQFKGIASSQDVLVSISAYSQSEVSIAIDPNNPNNLLVGTNSGPVSVNPSLQFKNNAFPACPPARPFVNWS